MKSRARKKYSTEFKREAVGLVVDQGYSKAEAGRSLDVNPNLIRRWQREFEAEGGCGHYRLCELDPLFVFGTSSNLACLFIVLAPK